MSTRQSDHYSSLRETVRSYTAAMVELTGELIAFPLKIRPEMTMRKRWTLAASIQRVTGRPARFEMCPGLLEIRFYAERGIPAFAYGPGLLTVSHGPNEFVPVRRIVECAEVYALTAVQLFASQAV